MKASCIRYIVCRPSPMEKKTKYPFAEVEARWRRAPETGSLAFPPGGLAPGGDLALPGAGHEVDARGTPRAKHYVGLWPGLAAGPG